MPEKVLNAVGYDMEADKITSEFDGQEFALLVFVPDGEGDPDSAYEGYQVNIVDSAGLILESEVDGVWGDYGYGIIGSGGTATFTGTANEEGEYNFEFELDDDPEYNAQTTLNIYLASLLFIEFREGADPFGLRQMATPTEPTLINVGIRSGPDSVDESYAGQTIKVLDKGGLAHTYVESSPGEDDWAPGDEAIIDEDGIATFFLSDPSNPQNIGAHRPEFMLKEHYKHRDFGTAVYVKDNPLIVQTYYTSGYLGSQVEEYRDTFTRNEAVIHHIWVPGENVETSKELPEGYRVIGEDETDYFLATETDEPDPTFPEEDDAYIWEFLGWSEINEEGKAVFGAWDYHPEGTFETNFELEGRGKFKFTAGGDPLNSNDDEQAQVAALASEIEEHFSHVKGVNVTTYGPEVTIEEASNEEATGGYFEVLAGNTHINNFQEEVESQEGTQAGKWSFEVIGFEDEDFLELKRTYPHVTGETSFDTEFEFLALSPEQKLQHKYKLRFYQEDGDGIAIQVSSDIKPYVDQEKGRIFLEGESDWFSESDVFVTEDNYQQYSYNLSTPFHEVLDYNYNWERLVSPMVWDEGEEKWKERLSYNIADSSLNFGNPKAAYYSNEYGYWVGYYPGEITVTFVDVWKIAVGVERGHIKEQYSVGGTLQRINVEEGAEVQAEILAEEIQDDFEDVLVTVDGRKVTIEEEAGKAKGDSFTINHNDIENYMEEESSILPVPGEWSFEIDENGFGDGEYVTVDRGGITSTYQFTDGGDPFDSNDIAENQAKALASSIRNDFSGVRTTPLNLYSEHTREVTIKERKGEESGVSFSISEDSGGNIKNFTEDTSSSHFVQPGKWSFEIKETGLGSVKEEINYPPVKIYDGTVVKEEEVTIKYDAEPPEDDQDNRYGYTFDFWRGPILPFEGERDHTFITERRVLEARYKGPNVYTVSYRDWNNKVIGSEKVLHGRDASPPSLSTDFRKGYDFIGWEGNPEYIDSGRVLNAQYNIHIYPIYFEDYDGTILKTEYVEYGGSASPPADPSREGYAFVGWDGDVDFVEEPYQVFRAQYLPIYDVTFEDHDGTVLETVEVIEGNDAEPSQEPQRTGYTFVGWDPDSSNVQEDMTVVAQYEINQYTITFEDYDGFVMEQITQDYGTAIDPPDDPERTEYDFVGWDPELPGTIPAEDKTLTAQYEIKTYTVEFNLGDHGTHDGGGDLTQTIDHGSNAVEPLVDADEGYEFVGWDSSLNNITEDKLINATYVEDEHKVTFEDWDGTVLKVEAVADGGDATPPPDPERVGYTFTSWDGDYTNVTEDVTITAQYASETYTLTIGKKTGYDQGSVTGDGEYGCGDSVQLEATPDPGYEFSSWRNAEINMYTEENPYTFTMPDRNVTIEASFLLLSGWDNIKWDYNDWQ